MCFGMCLKGKEGRIYEIFILLFDTLINVYRFE